MAKQDARVHQNGGISSCGQCKVHLKKFCNLWFPAPSHQWHSNIQSIIGHKCNMEQTTKASGKNALQFQQIMIIPRYAQSDMTELRNEMIQSELRSTSKFRLNIDSLGNVDCP